MNRPEIAHCVASAPLYDSGYIILPNFFVILEDFYNHFISKQF